MQFLHKSFPPGLERIWKAEKMAVMMMSLLHHIKRRKARTPMKIQSSCITGSSCGRRGGGRGDGGGGAASDHRLQIPIFLHELKTPKGDKAKR